VDSALSPGDGARRGQEKGRSRSHSIANLIRKIQVITGLVKNVCCANVAQDGD